MAKETSSGEKFNKNLICQVARTGKFLDFSNGLVAAQIDDYAQLSGRGGKDHAPVAVIKADITDYKDKANPVKCTANVEPYIFEIINEIALRNVGTNGIGIGGASTFIADVSKACSIVETLMYSFGCHLEGIIEAAREMFKDTGMQQIGTKLGLGAKTATTSLLQYAIPAAAPLSVNQYTDWEHTITRVNTYSLDENGYATVREITFRRQQYRKDPSSQNAQAMKAPWYVSIANFKAKPLPDGVGYDGKSVLPDTKQLASINITDEEMIEMCYHIKNFVRVWQNAVSLPNVKTGCKLKEEERMAWLERRDAASA